MIKGLRHSIKNVYAVVNIVFHKHNLNCNASCFGIINIVNTITVSNAHSNSQDIYINYIHLDLLYDIFNKKLVNFHFSQDAV
jgi:hypothetical protein